MLFGKRCNYRLGAGGALEFGGLCLGIDKTELGRQQIAEIKLFIA